MRTALSVTKVVACFVALAGCAPIDDGRAAGEGDADRVGSISFDLTSAPNAARCAVLTAAPPTGASTQRTFSLLPGTTAVFTVSNLPTGALTLTEQVFTVVCSAIANQKATWVSDPVSVTLVAGTPADVSFALRRVDAGGQAVVRTSFPDTQPKVALFPVPGAPTISHIISGPDDNLWFTAAAAGGSAISRITPAGAITPVVAFAGNTSLALANGPDGAVWFVEGEANKVGRTTLAGIANTFDVPTPTSALISITRGADGNMWFLEGGTGKVGRVTLLGAITEFFVTPTSRPQIIAPGPDGNLWFTEANNSVIGRLSPSGTLTEFSTPTANSGPVGIVTGPDGNLWFTEDFTGTIGRCTPTGTITEFHLPATALPVGPMIVGSDGNLWFAESDFAHTKTGLGRMTTAGVYSEFSLPGATLVSDLTAGPDGNIWFADSTGKVGRFGPLTNTN